MSAPSAPSGAAPGLSSLLALVVFVFLAFWAKDDIAAWALSWKAPQPATSATITCTRPDEFETLLITVNLTAPDTYRVGCGPVAGAGAYRRARP